MNVMAYAFCLALIFINSSGVVNDRSFPYPLSEAVCHHICEFIVTLRLCMKWYIVSGAKELELEQVFRDVTGSGHLLDIE
jgi:hypothetical protein